MRPLEILGMANGNLRSARARTILTILSIFVGALTLTLSLGASSGLSNYIRSQGNLIRDERSLTITRGGGGSPTGLGGEEYDAEQGLNTNPPLDADDLDAVRAIPGVEKVEPVLSVQAEYVELGDKRYTLNLAQYLPTMETDAAAGALSDIDKPGELAIGYALAKKLGFDAPDAAVGSTVTVVVFDQLRKPQRFEFVVAAVLPPSLIYNGAALVPRARLDEMLQFQAAGVEEVLFQPPSATVYLQDGTDMAAVKDAITEVGLSARSVKDEADAQAATLRPISQALYGFSLVAIVASMFGIVNTLLMSVKERTREIGLMKALGAPDKQIFRLFAAESAMLGLWGSGLGMLLGVVAGLGIGTLVENAVGDSLPGFRPFGIGPIVLLGAPIVIVTIALIAGVLPSRRAMKLDPIEALRYG